MSHQTLQWFSQCHSMWVFCKPVHSKADTVGQNVSSCRVQRLLCCIGGHLSFIVQFWTKLFTVEHLPSVRQFPSNCTERQACNQLQRRGSRGTGIPQTSSFSSTCCLKQEEGQGTGFCSYSLPDQLTEPMHCNALQCIAMCGNQNTNSEKLFETSVSAHCGLTLKNNPIIHT